MRLTLLQLQAAVPYSRELAAVFLPALNDAMDEFSIDTRVRTAAFLATIAHESASFHALKEYASGEAYDTGPLAAKLGNTLAADGDGQRLKGRGLIQLTGATNYRRCSLALNRDLLAEPTYLETPVGAARSAAWFWKDAGCNEAAELGNFGTVCKLVNGGYIGLDGRIQAYLIARRALGL